MCEAYNIRHRREFSQQLAEMKLMRWIGSLIYNSNVPKNHRKDAEKLYPLPELDDQIKENKKLKIPSKEEIEEIRSWSMPAPHPEKKTLFDFLYPAPNTPAK